MTKLHKPLYATGIHGITGQDMAECQTKKVLGLASSGSANEKNPP